MLAGALDMDALLLLFHVCLRHGERWSLEFTQGHITLSLTHVHTAFAALPCKSLREFTQNFERLEGHTNRSVHASTHLEPKQ